MTSKHRRVDRELDHAQAVGVPVLDGHGHGIRFSGFPTAPLVLALIQGYMAESNFRWALIMGNASIFFTRPVSATMLVLAVLSFGMPFYRARKAKKRADTG